MKVRFHRLRSWRLLVFPWRAGPACGVTFHAGPFVLRLQWGER